MPVAQEKPILSSSPRPMPPCRTRKLLLVELRELMKPLLHHPLASAAVVDIKRQHIRRRTAIPFWYEPICRGADPLLLDSPCQASLLTLDRRCPRCDIASFYVWTDDVHFGHRILVSPSFGNFTSPIPAPLFVRNVINDSHRCPSRLDVEYPPGLFCHREENLSGKLNREHDLQRYGEISLP